jgi:plasmid stabilization system protein ParE
VARIIWSPEAGRRLIDIDAYLRIAAPERADTIVEHIVAAAERLAAFPRLGGAFRDASTPSARELMVDSYRIVYATDGETIEIATVLHNAINIPTRLRELLGDV